MKKPALPSLPRLALLVFVLVPALAWAVVRPVRVMAPEWAGVVCVEASVCVDDMAKLDSAKQLYAEATDFVERQIAPIDRSPRIIFCSTQACADSFGLGARSAVTLATFGTVIGPLAWKAFYIRHELIHYQQFRILGVVRVLRSPSWLVEGMAYSLSEDPRQPLAEPFQSWRSEFIGWLAGADSPAMWKRASQL